MWCCLQFIDDDGKGVDPLMTPVKLPLNQKIKKEEKPKVKAETKG